MHSADQNRSVLCPPPSALCPKAAGVLAPSSALFAQKPRLAYILAASHSGSTLLAMLLGSHPEACTAGELKGVRGDSATYRCSCGIHIQDCEFWLQVNASMAARGFQFEITRADTNIQGTDAAYIHRLLQPLHRGPLLELVREIGLAAHPRWHSHLRRIQDRNTALVGSLLGVSGAKVIIDSSKVGLRLKYLLRNRSLDVRVLRLFRDGRGVSLTHTNPAEFADATDPRLRSGGTGIVRPDFRLSMHEAAWLWRRSNEEADRATAALDSSQCMPLRYEDLCLRPSETVGQICHFLGISSQAVEENFRARKHQHVVGNGMRFDTTSELRADERWKNHLSPDDLKTFDRVAGNLNRQYGYI
ncbi:MAG TPA: sulfotransferase [Verrucomicrobiae bacterium]|nr:sulfotransferase [Verrucomicrobiae bacterium]